MNIKEMRAIINLARKKHIAPYIWGEAGIGKSEVVKQVALDEGIGFIDLRLGTQETGDLIGMPSVQEGKTIWAKPSWFPREGTSGILFLDELNRGSRDVIQAIFQLVLDRRLHTHKLPDGWTIVCAGNPSDSDGYYVSELDKALLTRFVNIKLEPEVKEWLVWAKANKLNDLVVDFIENNRKMLVVSTKERYINPRVWTQLSRMLDDIEEENLMESVALTMLGENIGMEFVKFASQKDLLIKVDDIIYDYSKVQEKVLDLSKGKKSRVDILNKTNEELMEELNKLKTKSLKEKELSKIGQNIRAYLLDLPKDMAYSLIKNSGSEKLHDIIDENGKAVNTKEHKEFFETFFKMSHVKEDKK